MNIEVIKWLGGGLAWLLSLYLTYLFGKKKKIDELTIEKKLNIVKELILCLQDDFEMRQKLILLFEENFSHMEREKVYFDLRNSENKYTNIKELINELEVTQSRLSELQKRFNIYFKSKALGKYIETLIFTFETDGMFISTYYDNFFETLLREENKKFRIKNYSKLLKELRKINY